MEHTRRGTADTLRASGRTPFGWVEVAVEGDEVTGLAFVEDATAGPPPRGARGALAREAIAQVRDYVRGRRDELDLPVALTGTPFQHEVWDEVARIPRGATITYAELARRVGRTGSFRAVGAANGSNPVALVVPCHRVVGSDGGLTGYGGGVDVKERLLRLEGVEVRDGRCPDGDTRRT